MSSSSVWVRGISEIKTDDEFNPILIASYLAFDAACQCSLEVRKDSATNFKFKNSYVMCNDHNVHEYSSTVKVS